MTLTDFNIPKKIDEYIIANRKAYAPRCNYASSAGHPCERKLVYDRLNWQEKLLMSPRAVKRTDVGKLLEKYAIGKIEEAGFNVVEQQRPLEWPDLELSGRIEGQINYAGGQVLFEIKSMDQYDFDGISSANDLLKSSKWWVRGYYDQFQLYLLLLDREGGLFFLVSLKGDIKSFPVVLDYDYAEKIAKKLERVNKAVKSRQYPDRITEKNVCEMCDFRHVCLPDEGSTAINFLENAELLELLDQREALKEHAKSYETVDKRIKDMLENQPEGTHLVSNKYQIKISTYERKFSNVPDEIKAKFEETKTYSKVTITALK